MPLQGEAKRRAQAKWRAGRSPAYYAWLYARRRVRFENAEAFRIVLEAVALCDDLGAAKKIAELALDEADQAEVAVGNRYDHEKDRPYYQTEGMMLGGAEAD